MYNEFFGIKYKVENDSGHDVVLSVCKNYLDAYRATTTNKNDFYIVTLKKEKNLEEDSNKFIEIFDYAQNVSRLYMQKDNKTKSENNGLSISTFDGDIGFIKDIFFENKITLIFNCLTEEDDFALFFYNMINYQTQYFYGDSQSVVINLGFNSHNEKKNWLDLHPFKTFFDKKVFYNGFSEISIKRNELRLPFEIIYDQTKYYIVDRFDFDAKHFSTSISDFMCLGNLRNWNVKKPLSYSYFHKFSILNGWDSSEKNYNFLEKYKNIKFSKKITIKCEYYRQNIQFYIIRYVERINLVEFIKNQDLCEVVTEIICVRHSKLIGKTCLKYIANISEIDSPFMPAYEIDKNNKELKENIIKFEASVHKVNNYFKQGFAEFDNNLLNFDD
ncbi:hypothetical protein COBT_000325 [Conglomerata obtusa]